MNRTRPATTRLAGWLFADLLLVMVLVALSGAESTGAGPAPCARPSSAGCAPTTSTTTPTAPTPSRTPESPAPTGGGLDPVTESITVRTDPEALVAGTDAAETGLKREVVRKIRKFSGERAAFVIVFGNAGRLPGGAVDTDASTRYAEAVARLLPSAAPRFFPPYHPKIIRGYHNTDRRVASGTARIELFFLLH
ncbi:hypothetical protein ACH4CD_10140 [Streptomyces fungicidicus]|uniref:hypothetical protein n=1 Tax=Streptomyces fungicidicus TaxID=68203 RepID=UPI0037BCEE6E